MKLLLLREPSTEVCTPGLLFIEGRFFAWTLEDVVREIKGKPVKDWKVYGQTAIPYGVYTLDMTFSPKFQKVMPLVMAVPGFEGIRIHSGNTAEHSEGCILVGRQRVDKNPSTAGIDTITESKLAFADLMDKLLAADQLGVPMSIEIAPVDCL